MLAPALRRPAPVYSCASNCDDDRVVPAALPTAPAPAPAPALVCRAPAVPAGPTRGDGSAGGVAIGDTASAGRGDSAAGVEVPADVDVDPGAAGVDPGREPAAAAAAAAVARAASAVGCSCCDGAACCIMVWGSNDSGRPIPPMPPIPAAVPGKLPSAKEPTASDPIASEPMPTLVPAPLPSPCASRPRRCAWPGLLVIVIVLCRSAIGMATGEDGEPEAATAAAAVCDRATESITGELGAVVAAPDAEPAALPPLAERPAATVAVAAVEDPTAVVLLALLRLPASAAAKLKGLAPAPAGAGVAAEIVALLVPEAVAVGDAGPAADESGCNCSACPPLLRLSLGLNGPMPTRPATVVGAMPAGAMPAAAKVGAAVDGCGAATACGAMGRTATAAAAAAAPRWSSSAALRSAVAAAVPAACSRSPRR